MIGNDEGCGDTYAGGRGLPDHPTVAGILRRSERFVERRRGVRGR